MSLVQLELQFKRRSVATSKVLVVLSELDKSYLDENELELSGMDHDDDSFDSDRDDCQDDLAVEGLPQLTPEAAFLLCASGVAVLFVVVLASFEAWRIINGS